LDSLKPNKRKLFFTIFKHSQQDQNCFLSFRLILGAEKTAEYKDIAEDDENDKDCAQGY